jgi:chemotaxis protein methyltransferase CheR
MNRWGVKTYDEYFDTMKNDEKKLREFLDHLTINVSEFFRTPEKFGKLETDVIPDLLTRSSKLNIWSAGCSIGAEPYSLAMIMKEMTPNVRHRILASDLDVEILAKAKRGIYTDNELKAMTPQRRAKYFDVVEGDKYAVKQEIKDCIEFKRHNLLKDKFEEGFDLILCRNVVIYFTEEAKDQLYANFFKALKPGGILFVGATEAILNFRKLGYTSFQPFFYQKPLT